VFTIQNPDRLVLDVTVPDGPPPAPGAPPAGVEVRVVPAGGARLTLVTLDPARYEARVVAAPFGAALNVLEHAQAAGAVVAVNGGYFDPPTGLPVDLVVSGSELLGAARGNRGTVGLDAGGLRFGTPSARLWVAADGRAPARVSAVGPAPRAGWLTAFTGDGFRATGASGFATLVVQDGAVLERREGEFVPARGQFTLSFEPAAWPALDVAPGAPVSASLAWSDATWGSSTGAVAAGPELLRDGLYVVDAAREGFDPLGSIWRPTRQAALATDWQGRPVVAFLDTGTPETLARALALAGLRSAVRMDSGTSAAVYVAGGMLNGLWGRPVPNAVVFVPRAAR
jgi:hypothetical protein